jgi:hypothetical protein
MPWTPELFTWPALQRLLDARRVDKLARVPYFDGFLTDEPDALIGSFSGEPLVHDPIRGRIRGVAAFRAYFAEMHDWLGEHHVVVEDVSRVVLGHGGFEEVIVHYDGRDGRVALQFATVTDRAAEGGIAEVRAYHGTLPSTGRRAIRPPLLQADPALRVPDIVAEHQRGLSAGDADAVVAAFDPEGHVRDPTGGERPHAGHDALRRFYRGLLASGGIAEENCTIGCDGDVCALEYNIVGWGGADLPPQAGMAVYVRGPSGRLHALRVYHDLEPPRVPRAR